MNSRERWLALLENRPVDHLALMPITMMFAAAQRGVLYGDYVTDHRVLVEAQTHVAEKFGFDYVSCISDPAREAADLGADVHFFEDQPPAINEENARLKDKTALASLKVPDPLGGGRMFDRVQAAALFQEKAGKEKIIEGWVEGPCAEAADLRGINALMLDFHDDPGFVRDLFEFVIETAVVFARAQVEAGVDVIGVGDAASSLVGPAIYTEFVWPYQKKLVDRLHALGTRVRLHICGKTRKLYEGLGRTGSDIIDLDWMNPMDEARQAMGPEQLLLGNIDPVQVLREGTAEDVTNGIAECHRQAGPRYIVGAGCEVPRDTPEANVRALCEYAFAHAPDAYLDVPHE